MITVVSWFRVRCEECSVTVTRSGKDLTEVLSTLHDEGWSIVEQKVVSGGELRLGEVRTFCNNHIQLKETG